MMLSNIQIIRETTNNSVTLIPKIAPIEKVAPSILDLIQLQGGFNQLNCVITRIIGA